jgi:predicted O-methyltransferase YrrM
MVSDWLTIFLLMALSASIGVLYRKVSRVDRETWHLKQHVREVVDSAQWNTYRQLEALQALNVLLRLEVPLPPLRGWAASPDFLRQLAELALRHRPSMIVECSSGASTVVLARCCQLLGTGHVYSLEHDATYAAQTRAWLADAGLTGYATVMHAPLKDTSLDGQIYPWYSLDELPASPIDLLVVDGPPGTLRSQARFPAGPLLIPRLAGGGVVVVDDADRPDESQMLSRWIELFPGLRKEIVPAEKGMTMLSRSALCASAPGKSPG